METRPIPVSFAEQLPPNSTISNGTNMPFSHFLDMHTPTEQSIPPFYGQGSVVRAVDFPSSGPLDSGYAEADPFDKDAQYHAANNLNFDQTCTMHQHGTTSLDFGDFGCAPQMNQQDMRDFNSYTASELTPTFQPLMDQMDPYNQCQPSPGLDDASEDGRTASLSSESPQQASFGIETSPQQPQQSFWSSTSSAQQRRTTESSAEMKPTTENRTLPKVAPTRGRPRKRIPHTAVERRYRENLNAHLERLREAVPNLTAAQRRKSTDGADPMKPSKCEVLMGAVDYIKRLETENDGLKQKLNA